MAERDLGEPGLGQQALRTLGAGVRRSAKPTLYFGAALAAGIMFIRGVQETFEDPSQIKDIPQDTRATAEKFIENVGDTWDVWAK